MNQDSRGHTESESFPPRNLALDIITRAALGKALHGWNSLGSLCAVYSEQPGRGAVETHQYLGVLNWIKNMSQRWKTGKERMHKGTARQGHGKQATVDRIRRHWAERGMEMCSED